MKLSREIKRKKLEKNTIKNQQRQTRFLTILLIQFRIEGTAVSFGTAAARQSLSTISIVHTDV